MSSPMLQVTPTALDGVLVLTSRVFQDPRGFFFESFNAERFAQATGQTVMFVQDNHSASARHVLRGLHWQCAPHEQGKLVRALAGEIFDVVVDIRPQSPSFGRWIGERLSADNHRQLWIPGGFAHGFLTLTERAEVSYKTTDYYSPAHERCLAWDDATVGIAWPLEGQKPLLSDKDALGISLAQVRALQGA